MNHTLSKLLCNIFFVFASFLAKGSDTTLLASHAGENVTVPLTTNMVRPSNVIYPVCLQKSKDQSLEFVRNFSKKKRAYLIDTYQKGKKFFPQAAAILKQYNLPQELKVLVAIESGFNANAVSGAGAVGYWQIMDEAAKEYGLRIADHRPSNKPCKIRDDRRNFAKSTVAAAQYMRDRGRNLNDDPLLIVASYNCGLGKIFQAIKKSGKAVPTFWDIKKYLPNETKSYVMNFIALSVIYENYDNFLSNQLLFNPQTIEVPVPDITKQQSLLTD